MDPQEKIRTILDAIGITKFYVIEASRTFKIYENYFNDNKTPEIDKAIKTTIAVLNSLEEYFKNISDTTEQINWEVAEDEI